MQALTQTLFLQCQARDGKVDRRSVSWPSLRRTQPRQGRCRDRPCSEERQKQERGPDLEHESLAPCRSRTASILEETAEQLEEVPVTEPNDVPESCQEPPPVPAVHVAEQAEHTEVTAKEGSEAPHSNRPSELGTLLVEEDERRRESPGQPPEHLAPKVSENPPNALHSLLTPHSWGLRTFSGAGGGGGGQRGGRLSCFAACGMLLVRMPHQMRRSSALREWVLQGESRAPSTVGQSAMQRCDLKKTIT